MTEQDRLLLIQDLCARLPYKVVIRCKDSDTDYKCFLTKDILDELIKNHMYYDYKPYLRPLLSMSEDEEKVISDVDDEFLQTLVKKIQPIKDDNERIHLLQKAVAQRAFRTMQFYNRSHLDYNGLIERGLALEAPEGMYN